MGRVHARKVGEARGWVCRRPAQHVAELRCIGINGVPGDQELGRKHGDSLFQAVLRASLEIPGPIPPHIGMAAKGDDYETFKTMWEKASDSKTA